MTGIDFYPPKLNPEVKEKWLEALRSGSYEQTNAYLSHDGGYCCLGVLCEIAVADQVLVKAPHLGETQVILYISARDSSDWSTKILPLDALGWSGLHESNPTLLVYLEDLPSEAASRIALTKEPYDQLEEPPRYRLALAEANDIYGLDFNQIADLVEKYL